ncbi:hypothetical protein KYK29_03940 [Shinella daejeonensis]|nr:hypothetical protein [Shinella daejeonensis]
MMFGMSVFESVLERLRQEADEGMSKEGTAADSREPAGRRSPSGGFTGLGTGAPFVSGRQADAAYREIGEPATPAPAPPPEAPPPHLLRIAPEEIAADLALTGKETVEALLARRRAFARDNHPDRAPAALRANATLRMKIANMLIDETIRRSGPGSGAKAER